MDYMHKTGKSGGRMRMGGTKMDKVRGIKKNKRCSREIGKGGSALGKNEGQKQQERNAVERRRKGTRKLGLRSK